MNYDYSLVSDWLIYHNQAEEEGLEPPQAEARQFSRLLQYHYAIPPALPTAMIGRQKSNIFRIFATEISSNFIDHSCPVPHSSQSAYFFLPALHL